MNAVMIETRIGTMMLFIQKRYLSSRSFSRNPYPVSVSVITGGMSAKGAMLIRPILSRYSITTL